MWGEPGHLRAGRASPVLENMEVRKEQYLWGRGLSSDLFVAPLLLLGHQVRLEPAEVILYLFCRRAQGSSSGSCTPSLLFCWHLACGCVSGCIISGVEGPADDPWVLTGARHCGWQGHTAHQLGWRWAAQKGRTLSDPFTLHTLELIPRGE